MGPDHDSETEALIRAAQCGGPARDVAFDMLLARYWPRVYRLCWRYLGNKAQAEDAAQETWLRAYRSIDRFELCANGAGGDTFEHWLLRIAKNLCLDILRARERRGAEQSLDSDDAEAAGPPDLGPSPLEHALAGELRDVVLAAIGCLTELQRSVVLLRYAGMDNEEIACQLDIPLGTVKSRMNSAWARLRDLLKEYRYEPQQRD